MKTGAVRIDPNVLKDAKIICINIDVKVQDYVTTAVKEKNEKEGRK